MLKNLYLKYLALFPDSGAMSLDNWKGKKFGQYLLDAERELLGKDCAELAGYRLMHLGLAGARCALEPFNQLHQFYIRPSDSPVNFECNSAVAAYEELPLPSDVVDVAIVQHALEYSVSPQAVLAETVRVLAPGGHLILCVLNPWGPVGLVKLPMRLITRRAEYEFYNLRKRRVFDWLSLLNCEVIGIHNGAYNLPFERTNWLRRDSAWHRICEKIRFPMGNFYMIHAVKRVAGGIRNATPSWRAVTTKPYRSKHANINRSPHGDKQ
jgi:SAM-dependent methyltransferase